MEPRIDLRWRVPLPVFRRLRVFASDPGTTTRYDTAVTNETIFLVPWEDLQPGPIGEYVAVVDKNEQGKEVHPPIDLNDAPVVTQDGVAPSDGNPQFHHQMAYAVAMRTIRNFERSLGRCIHWKPRSEPDPDTGAPVSYRQRMEIYPHYSTDTNAYYNTEIGALCFGYFRALPESPFPGTTVYTCLSHDVIAHEITHAILDGMDISFKGQSLDVIALHEAYSDLIAILQHFWPSDVFRHQIAEVRGKLENSFHLGSIAPQFGQAVGRREGLRNAFGAFDEKGVWQPRVPDSKAYAQTPQPHDRGAIVVCAVFEALKKIYEARTADLRRIASKGTGILPDGHLHPDLVNRLSQEASRCAQRVLEMVIRALDYMPPVETTFGDFLRAIVTADYDMRPVDDGNYRLAFVDAFRSYGIVPPEVGTLSQDTLLWRPPPDSDGARAVGDFVRELTGQLTPWNLPRDRKELWKLLQAKRDQLQSALADKPVKSIGPINLNKPFAVESFQPRESTEAKGTLAFQWVIKLVQEQPRRRAAANREAAADDDFDNRPWAGVTLIVNGDDGTIRYQIERKTMASKRKVKDSGPKIDATPCPPPAFREFRVFAFDPSMGRARDTIGLNEARIRVPWEPPKDGLNQPEPGPVGEYVEVIDRDPASQCYYEPVDVNSLEVMAQHGLPPSESSPQFHQQMVYAVAMRTIRTFERALGRLALWRSHSVRNADGSVSEENYVQRLRIYPHALREANAYYSPDKVALLFGYFSAPAGQGTAARLTVFSCLSHDIIAHEVTHALLDGMHRRFSEPSNADVLAFHEAFADIVALFQHFSLPEVLNHQIASTRGDLAGQSLLGQLAQEFGQAVGGRGALRSAIGKEDSDGKWNRNKGDPDDYQRSIEPHARGAVLVAAVFDAFLSIYQGRVADLFRIATEGTGVLPEGSLHPDLVERLTFEASQSARQVLDMCIRALDYCPPVDITFGDYLRALVTADFENDPVDDEGRRVAFIEAFRRRGIVPENVQAFSVDGLLWRAASGAPDEDAAVVVGIVKSWASEISSWGLSKDRWNLFELMRDRRKGLHSFLRSKMKKDEVVLAGIDPELPFEVHSLRPSIRMDWEGRPSFQWVIELTQRIPQYVDGTPEGNERPDYYFRGGCTLLVDAETGRVRYSIKKKLNDERKARQRRYFVDEGSRSLAATYFGPPGAEEREPFAVLHRH